MQFSYNDVKDLLTFGMGGALVATAYQFTTTMMKKTTGGALSTETEVLERSDPLLVVWLLELETDARKCDAIAYIRIIDSADRLLYLLSQIENKKITNPTPMDRENAYIYFKRAELSLARLVKVVESTMTPQQIVRIQTICKHIVEQLEKHLANVFLLTRDVA